MKVKVTYLMLSLLLAVGWTSTAHAQVKAGAKLKKAPIGLSGKQHKRAALNLAIGDEYVDATPILEQDEETVPHSSNLLMRAPRRAASAAAAPVVHPKEWYDQWYYTWTDASGNQHSTYFTEEATDPYQMIALTSIIYSDTDFPGIHYNGQRNSGAGVVEPYWGIEYGWGIDATNYDDIVITLSGSAAYINRIYVTSEQGDTLTRWVQTTSTTQTLPSGWTSSKTLYYNSSTLGCYMSGGGTITIPGSLCSSNRVRVGVRIRGTDDNSTATVKINDTELACSGTFKGWYTRIRGTRDLPKENGYTVMLVKLKNYDTSSRPPKTTKSREELVNYFDTYIESLTLLTDGLRVAEDTENSGTVFTYTGDLNRFYFISKGKLYPLSSLEADTTIDLAPMYSMFEEFSPTATTGGSTDDFYSQMVVGNSYGVVHDCQGVAYLKHFFSMTGIDGTENKSLSNLIFYIPDNRAIPSSRNYSEEHQPQTGLYTIALTASAQRVEDYADDNRYYNVTVNWTSSLDIISGVEVPQTYELWRVTRDENGNPVRVNLLTTTTDTTYTYIVPQDSESYTIEYMVKGTPKNATNPDQFYTWSNIDNVLIPGYYDFVLLMNGHYESDFETGNKPGDEKNYYRNYMYLANSSEGTGMRLGQIKREWPNQTARYTLWRDNRLVATLQMLAIGDKVYYKIVHDEASQDVTGPNAITVTNPSNTK